MPSTANVWLAGPCRIIGGGLSVKTKTQRHFQDILTSMKFRKLYIVHSHSKSKMKAPKSNMLLILISVYSIPNINLSSTHTTHISVTYFTESMLLFTIYSDLPVTQMMIR